MRRAVKKQEMLARRHRRVRGSVSGTAERPRLAVHRSHKQIYVQVIDDVRGVTLVASSSLRLAKGGEMGDAKGGNISGATVVGTDIAKKAKEAGIEAVCFDRGGYRYHGRIKALADAARKAGLEF
jgi:large subunit ribosomal protein L18